MRRDELLRAWVKALESGKYEQAHSRLRRDDAYCCLGVLCEVSGVGKWRQDGDYLQYACPVDADGVFTPDDVARLIPGIEEHEGDLAIANDDGRSFVEIAERIRTLYPDVFAAEVVA